MLFGVPDAPEPKPPKESPTVRRTRRQAAMLAAGLHPLSTVLGTVSGSKLRLHTEAAPYGDHRAPGRRCGNCRFRKLVHGGAQSYPKCAFGDGARVSHGAATDCRAWWPACSDHEWKIDG